MAAVWDLKHRKVCSKIYILNEDNTAGALLVSHRLSHQWPMPTLWRSSYCRHSTTENADQSFLSFVCIPPLDPSFSRTFILPKQGWHPWLRKFKMELSDLGCGSSTSDHLKGLWDIHCVPWCSLFSSSRYLNASLSKSCYFLKAPASIRRSLDLSPMLGKVIVSMPNSAICSPQ